MEEKDLATLLTNGLNDLARRIDESRAENRQQFERVDGQFAQVDGRFAQVDGRFEQVDGRFGKLENEVREAHIQIEGLRGEIHQVADGVANVDEKLERHIVESRGQFDDVRALMRLSYAQLEQRITALELRDEPPHSPSQ